MLKDLLGGIILVSASLFVFGISETAVWGQYPAKTGEGSSPVIVQVGDYVVRVKDLDKIISTYPSGSVSSRESKVRLVEGLITTKLFSSAARAAKLDANPEFQKTKAEARENVLTYAYIQRHVQPKYSEDAARAYFESHKDELKYFSYYRNEIVATLKKQAVEAATQSLMKQWPVKRREDLKELNLRQADPSLVLAQVEDKTVTVRDLSQLAADRYEEDNLSALALEQRLELIDWLVLERLSLLEAVKVGLANDPEVQKALAGSEDQLLAAQYMRLIQGKVTVEDARRYYQAHPEEYKRSDNLRLRQIVVATLEQAREVKAKVDAGQPFEEVAKTFSIDQVSAAKGGEIGWVRRGRLSPEVEKVAFQLNLKQTSEPIKTPDGYVMVMVEERLAGSTKPFNEAAPQILVKLREEAQAAERERLMTVYKVTINKELL